jgi:hypothetical protein
MSKVNRPKSGTAAKQRRERIARRRWREPTLAALKLGDGKVPEGVDRMLARELHEARYGAPKTPPSGS